MHHIHIYIHTHTRTHTHAHTRTRTIFELEPCKQEHLFSHFSLAGHDGFLNDVSVTLIDKTDPSDDPLRREDYWRQILKAMISCGLNIEDSV